MWLILTHHLPPEPAYLRVIDCKDAKFGRVEVPGIASLIDGIMGSIEKEEERVARAMDLFDALYDHLAAADA
jgi:hypothetical protein